MSIFLFLVGTLQFRVGFLCFKKGSIFCEVFAEGSLPERHTLVLKKGPFLGEVFVEGSPPECHSQVLNTFFFRNGNLCFLTHSRDLGAKLGGK